MFEEMISESYSRQQHNREIEGKIIGIQKKNAATRFANHVGSPYDQLWRSEAFKKLSLVLNNILFNIRKKYFGFLIGEFLNFDGKML